MYLSMSLLISHSNTVGPSSQAASARHRTATVFTESWKSPNFFIIIASAAERYLALLSSAAWYCTSWARAVGGGGGGLRERESEGGGERSMVYFIPYIGRSRLYWDGPHNIYFWTILFGRLDVMTPLGGRV